MAETAAKTTTPRRPRQRAGAASKAPTQAARPRKPAAKATVEATFTFSLAYIDDTKNYSRFDQSLTVEGNSTGFASNSKIYAPLGTTAVQVTITGPSDVIEEVAEAVADE